MNTKKENEYLVIDFTVNFLKIVFHVLSLAASFGIISSVFIVVIPNEIITNVITSIFLVPIEILVAMFIPITLKSSEKGLKNVSFTITLCLITSVLFSAFLTTVGTSNFWVSSYIKNVETPLKQTETTETKKLEKSILHYSNEIALMNKARDRRKSTYYTDSELINVRSYLPIIAAKEKELMGILDKIRIDNVKIMESNNKKREFEKIKSFGFGFFIQLAIVFITVCHYYIKKGRIENTVKQQETTVNTPNNNNYNDDFFNNYKPVNGVDLDILKMYSSNKYEIYQPIADKLNVKRSQVTETIQNFTKQAFKHLINKSNLQTA